LEILHIAKAPFDIAVLDDKAQVSVHTFALRTDDATSMLKGVKVPGSNIDLAVILGQLRALLGISDTKVSGELEKSEDSKLHYKIRAHVAGDRTWSTQLEGPDLLQLVNEVAEKLVEQYEPLSAGFYYLHQLTPDNSNFGHAIALANRFRSTDRRQQAWALTLRAMASRGNQASDRTRANLCAAIGLDPNFTLPWRMLAGVLRDDDDLVAAKDLALRLIRSRPRDPEGFRQLGAIDRDCPDDASTPMAQRYFEHALELGGDDYITLVDYGRWLFSHLSAEKREYLEMAAKHFSRAQQLAPDNGLTSANLARALGYPRLYKSENLSERASRYMEAEIMANNALGLDEHSPFANFVMAELLTDEGVVEHRYADRGRFTEARLYITRARAAAAVPQAMYEAIAARAFAANGDIDAAISILSAFPGKNRSYWIEWVYGELLYNKYLSGTQSGLVRLDSQKAVLDDALNHVRTAHSLHACGVRSDVITDLELKIEKEVRELQTQGEVRVEPERPAASDRAFSPPVFRRPLSLTPTAQTACPNWPKLEGPEFSSLEALQQRAPSGPIPSFDAIR
jgi:tetratricopeptide (TPR) repeat protein